MRTEHDFMIQKTNRNTYAAKMQEMKAKYDEKISVLRNELELRRRADPDGKTQRVRLMRSATT